MTLRLRLLLVLVGIVAVGLVASDVVTYTSLRSYLLSQVDQQLESAAPTIGQQVASDLSPGFFDRPHNSQVFVPPDTFLQLRDASGTVISLPEAGFDLPTPTLPGTLPGSGSSSTAPDLFTTGSAGKTNVSYRVLAEPLQNAAGADLGTVVVAVSLTGVHQTVGRLLLIEVLVTAAVLALLGGLAWWLVRRELRPLDQMATTAGSIAAGDLTQRVAYADAETEVGRLGAALNTMLGEIEEAFGARAASEERLRRFLADASHELRTPLTSIRGYAEIFDRGARDRPEDLATSMRHIRSEADRMSELVDDLLLLARLDRERPFAHDDVDLAAVVQASADAARAASPQRPITVDAGIPVHVMGDASRLRQVVDNLVSNAVKYTPEDSAIDIRVRSVDHQAVVEVQDHGPGVSPEEQRKIFEPFHRADPSRARASGGVGLGLAIASAITRAHAGDVGVISNGTGGATFWVRLPIATEVPA